MKILFLYDCLYPASLGGVEHRNFRLAQALADRGHEVVLAGFTEQPRRLGERIEVRSIAPPGRLYSAAGRRKITAALRLARAASRLPLREFDVIETANIPYAHLFPLAARAGLARRPLLVTWHEYWGAYWREYFPAPGWWLCAALEWLAVQLGTRPLAVSRFTARRVASHRLAGRAEVSLVPNGIPLKEIREIASSVARTGPPLVYAGRLMVEKRLDLLLDAVAILAPEHPERLLSLIGDGPDRERLERRARDLGISERIVFEGKLPTAADVWRRVATARIAVQPSSREGFGLFPLEAMAAGLPVVHCRSPHSAVADLVREGVDGLGVQADPHHLSAALRRLLEDPDDVARMAANAKRKAEDHDWGRVAVELETAAERSTARREPGSAD